MPQDLYPSINLYSSVGGPSSQWIVNPTSTYGTPAGFSFLSSWAWNLYDPTVITRSTTTTSNDTVTSKTLSDCNNPALGSVAIAASTKIMYSVTHSLYNGDTGFAGDAVGVGSATTSYLVYNTYLGITNQSMAIYENGDVYSNDNQVGSGYAVFQTAGQIIDVAVDTVNNKMWYRVAGGAWQG